MIKNDSVSFFEFVNNVTGRRFQWYHHALLLAGVLQAVIDGACKRLMIFMPPRHGKSELASRLLPAYFLHRNPEQWVGVCSYAANLSYTFSRNARDNYRNSGRELKEDSKAVSQWETGYGGGLWAAGVGGSQLGKGYHLGIIDDPIKNHQEALSLTIRERNRDWYDSTFLTRQEPNNAIVLIMQRWGKGDLADYILSKEHEDPEYWSIVNLEAIKTDKPWNYPDTCTIIDDNREVGAALCPERYPLEKLNKFKNNPFWEALYQQRRVSRRGLVYFSFNPDLHIIDELPYNPDICFYFTSHDFGGVNNVWLLVAKAPNGKFYVIDEEKLAPMTTNRRAQAIQSRIAGLKFLRAWGGSPGEDQQRKDYRAAGHPIQRPPVSDVESQVNSVNDLFSSGRLFVLRNCIQLIDHLENCSRDGNGNIADKSIWHFTDALRYFAPGVNKKTIGIQATVGEDRFS